MNKLLLVGLFTLLSGSVIAGPELKGSPKDLRGFLHPIENIVTINGSAEQKAYSDKAIVSLVITTKEKLLSTSIANNTNLKGKITASLIQAGIAADSIKSSKFSSSPEYGWFGSKPSSYKVVNRMAISVTTETSLIRIAMLADKHKEVELFDTSFEHTKKQAYTDKVKAMALEKILKQKEFYQKSLGVKLSPVGIRDSRIRHHATRGAMMLRQAVASKPKSEQDSYSSSTTNRNQTQPASFDEIKYEANLSVDFKISQ